MIHRLLFIFILTTFIISCDENSSDNSAPEKEILTKENIISVEATVIKKKLIENKIHLSGVLEPFNSVDIISEVSGKVLNIKKQLGEFVKQNEPLVVVDDIIPLSNFKQAKAQVQSAENNLEIAKSNLNSDKQLFADGDISELAFNNSNLAVKSAQANFLLAQASYSSTQKAFNDTKIKSPISGFVSRKKVNYGTMVSIGNMVYRVVDISKMKIFVSVSQEQINRIKIGGKVNISISALNNKFFSGVVKYLSPEADEKTGGFVVEINVDNKSGIIKGGMTAKLELLVSNQSKVLTVPGYSLVSKNDQYYVYKIVNGFASLKKIEIFETIGENIVINDGLNVGDTIVIVGMKNLGLKTKVNIEELL